MRQFYIAQGENFQTKTAPRVSKPSDVDTSTVTPRLAVREEQEQSHGDAPRTMSKTTMMTTTLTLSMSWSNSTIRISVRQTEQVSAVYSESGDRADLYCLA